MTQFLIYLILEFFMMGTTLVCLNNLTDKKIMWKYYKVIFFILVCPLLVINNLYTPEELKIITTLILNTITIKIVLSVSSKYSLYYSIIDFIIEIILEIILMIILSIFNFESLKAFNDAYIYKSFLTIVQCIMLILLFKNRKFIELLKKVIISIDNKINLTLIISSIAILLNIIALFIAKDLNNTNIFILSISSILFIIITIQEIVKDKYNIMLLKNLNDNLNSSIKAYSETIDTCRELKHNLKNDLISLKSELGEEEQTKINEVIIKYNKNYEWISNIHEIPKGLQGLLYIKTKEAAKKKINIISEINSDMKIDEDDYFNLSEIINILIDNAIEASIECKSKNIVFNIKQENDSMEISIINKFSNQIDLNKISDLNYSTKNRNTGIGLNYIKKHRKTNIKVNYKIIDDLFYATVIYKRKKNKKEC